MLKEIEGAACLNNAGVEYVEPVKNAISNLGGSIVLEQLPEDADASEIFYQAWEHFADGAGEAEALNWLIVEVNAWIQDYNRESENA